jgi:hypothetical protein
MSIFFGGRTLNALRKHNFFAHKLHVHGSDIQPLKLLCIHIRCHAHSLTIHIVNNFSSYGASMMEEVTGIFILCKIK